MTSNINFNARPVLQLFVIALCVVSQTLNRKITKMVLHVSLCLKSYLEKLISENQSFLLLMIGKQCGN